MVELISNGVFLYHGTDIVPADSSAALDQHEVFNKERTYKETMAYRILMDHQQHEGDQNLRIKFDALTSHDITYVGIIQTAIASGLDKFPIPYILTNCHNSLAAVGGTINEDDHVFGLSAVQRFGGVYVPPHLAVIHQYMRETMAGCGKMILGSDSHTRYGALGTMAIGEGGPELVKQLLGRTYDVQRPEVIAIYLDGKPKHGVGPQDVALAIEKAVFANGFVKNKVMEFVGPGIEYLSMDFRNGIDVMTTETTCLTTIWRTDSNTKEFLPLHGRGDAYKDLNPGDVAYYDGLVKVNLDEVESMIAMPFHPSNVYTIKEINEGGRDLLAEIERQAVEQLDNKSLSLQLPEKHFDGKLHLDQGIIVGCSGGLYENLMQAANIVRGKSVGSGRFAFSVYPSSQPIYLELMKNGALVDLMDAGAIVRTAFCGPCFGAGDTPANNGLSIRHTTRNFPNREGSKPGSGQMSAVALMDARSIAATAANKGVLIPATEVVDDYKIPAYSYDDRAYKNRVYQGFGKAEPEKELVYGPNIKDWPKMEALNTNILLKVCSKILDEVTTTDELIPSGETSSYRSNPLGLAQFTLSRRDPGYVKRSEEVYRIEQLRLEKKLDLKSDNEDLGRVFNEIKKIDAAADFENTEIGSMIYARKPGDGSAREQAASCQRVLGGLANIAGEYATKRYRSNLINWGMLPFLMKEEPEFEVGDYIYVGLIRESLKSDMSSIEAYVISTKKDSYKINLSIAAMTDEEKEIIKAGCLINYNRNRQKPV